MMAAGRKEDAHDCVPAVADDGAAPWRRAHPVPAMDCCAAPSAVLISPAPRLPGLPQSSQLRPRTRGLCQFARRPPAKPDCRAATAQSSSTIERLSSKPGTSTLSRRRSHRTWRTPARSPGWRVLDAGCGTGHHLAGVAAALRTPVVGLGVDIARIAAQRAARRWQELAFAVADVWTEWPVQDEAADLVLSIFAPKNFAEMSRVLRPGGWLALAYPGPITLPSSSTASASCSSMPAKPTATPGQCNGGSGHRPPFGSCTAWVSTTRAFVMRC